MLSEDAPTYVPSEKSKINYVLFMSNFDLATGKEM